MAGTGQLAAIQAMTPSFGVEVTPAGLREPGDRTSHCRWTVSFRNANESHTVGLDLVRIGQGWRIANITCDGNTTLRGVLTRK